VFRIEIWPVLHEAARAEIQEMHATHCVVPIPAYNLEGELIKPQSYRRTLEGALVELYFNLTHWSIAGRDRILGSDVYTADVFMIRVLAPPRATLAMTPWKRKINLFVEPGSSPTRHVRQRRT
jgi:hypothetical protein